MRLLHTLSATDVPAPGCNAARKAYYRNPPLLELPAQRAFAELQVSRLLGLWRVLDLATFEVGIRVVRTVGDWQYGSKHLTDVDFLLPRTADELASLTFEPDDTDTWLDVPDDDADEQEEGSGDAG